MAYSFPDGYSYLQNSSSVASVNKKYKQKYNKIKKVIKDLVFVSWHTIFLLILFEYFNISK